MFQREFVHVSCAQTATLLSGVGLETDCWTVWFLHGYVHIIV